MSVLDDSLVCAARKLPSGNKRDVNVMQYVDQYQRSEGIGNWAMEEMPHARRVLRNMRVFYDTFQDDPMVDENGGMKEFRIEY